MTDLLVISEIEFDKICRTCLSKGEMQYLYKNCNLQICLLEKLMSCTFVQYSEDDGLPKQICSNCVNEIEKAYIFAQKCQESDNFLRKYRQITPDVKYNKIKTENNKDNVNTKQTGQDENTEEVVIVLNDNDKAKEELINDIKSELDYEKECVEIQQSNKSRKTKLKTSPPYECKKCLKQFPLYYLLKEHYKEVQHSKNDYAKRICSICSKSVSYSHLKHHMRTHTLDKPYCCEFCGKRFIISSNLVRHKRIHSGEKPYKCDTCGKCFSQSTKVIEHRRIHTGERPYICNVCGKTFSRLSGFKTHLNRHEVKEENNVLKKRKAVVRNPVKCNTCNQKFDTIGALKTHQVTHGEKKFSCVNCGRGFISQEKLRSHTKVHSNLKPFSCVVCNKTFTLRTSLKNHMLIHTGEKPFACQFCEKVFSQLGHLKYHLRTHSGERPYRCKYCHKTFALNGNLTVHLRTHTGETPYLCFVCNKGFYDSSSMKKHLHVHGDVSN